jgi:molecular chaperone GrpE
MSTKNHSDEAFNINADENVSGTEKLNDPVDESQLDVLENELNESKDKYLRLAAEFDNFRRRTAKEKLELIQTAGKDVITDLLEILDDADRAAAQLESEENKSAREGVLLVFNKLKNMLQTKGLKEMNAVGQDFDPELHEAISEIPAPTKDLAGKVVDEIQKGYYLNDKIIRHARVVVGK